MVAEQVTNDQLVFIATILVGFLTVAGSLFGIWLTWKLNRIGTRQEHIQTQLKTTNGHTIGQYVEATATGKDVEDVASEA